ncbi:DUF3221 domain-containing protein [Paenibacillus donghaensis]|uniref:Uncharacterized protein n=1 Tax=Paenibacillus donghaensis TaxID=414771 RepID=A0A2Z2K818_9BACL|nr:DUF3221 domain-containing protein [Paenibacillus donghaensis]ASA21354.1 hypothetical protein B9T62_11495 [Paenibacillus donghaensis]
MPNMKRYWLGISAAALILGGCTDKEGAENAKPEPTPAQTMAAELAADSPVAKNGNSETVKVKYPGNVTGIRGLLKAEEIPNGDLYLQDDKLHVNIVGLTDEVEQRFAEKFTAGSYTLHDVKYTHQELEAAQKLIVHEQLHEKLNLYGTGIDVIGNRLTVTVPDDSAAAAKLELEKRVDPGMLEYSIIELGEPHVTGEIIEMEAGEKPRMLILEPGQEEPTYWFSISGKSELYDTAGETISFKSLKVGQKVDLWSTGTVHDSLPAQASLRRLELK